MREQQFGDLDRAVIIIGQREQRHLVATRDRGGKGRIRSKQLDKAIDSTRKAQSTDIAAERSENSDHLLPPLIVGMAKRRGVVVALDHIDIGTPSDQQPCDFNRAAVRREVKSAEPLLIGHVRRRSHLEQEFRNVRPRLLDCGKYCMWTAQILRMTIREPSQRGRVALHRGGQKQLFTGQCRPLGAVTNKQVDDVLPASIACLMTGSFE